MKDAGEMPVNEPLAAAVDRASEIDRRWFEAHPDDNVYVRPRISGEFGPVEEEAELEAFPWVRVSQIVPGVRVRRPFAHLEILSMS